jgi:hypothetical protein
VTKISPLRVLNHRLRGGSAYIKAVVLGFLTRQDEDLLDVDLSSNQSDEFRKVPATNKIVHLLSVVRWIGWYSIARTHAFIPTVCFWRKHRQVLFCVDIK